MRAALISVLLVSSVAHAHGGSGDHDSPQWCGEHLAVVGDGGVLVDGKLVKVPVTVALIAWSPACDRLVVAHERVWLIDAATRNVRDLGAPVGGFDSAMRMDGPAPSIRWSPSGKAFALVLVSETIDHMAVARYDAASGKGVLLPTNGEVKAFALVDDTHAVVAFRAQGANDMHLVTADERAAKSLNNTAYKEAMFSIAPVVLGLVRTTDELVLVDRTTGTERSLVSKVDYLQAMSADGSHALAVVGLKPASIDATGVASTFDGNLVYGSVSDEGTGWNASGTLTVVPALKTWAISAIGAKVRPWNGLPKGTVDHVSVHPDGKRAAFVVEVEEPLGKRDHHCDYEGRSRADLYVGELGVQAKPRKIATIAHLHSCAIE